MPKEISTQRALEGAAPLLGLHDLWLCFFIFALSSVESLAFVYSSLHQALPCVQNLSPGGDLVTLSVSKQCETPDLDWEP